MSKKNTKDVQPKVEEVKESSKTALEVSGQEAGVYNGDPSKTASEVSGEPNTRFHGDPHHAQSLLADPERRNEGIKYVAKHAWHKVVDDMDDGGRGFAANPDYDKLDPLQEFGLLSAVQAIVNDPLARPYASTMPRNSARDAYRDLDDAIRDTMGYARIQHED